MSETIFDMEALANIKDSILDIIMTTASPDLEGAKDIIRRIRRRELYKCVGKTSYQFGDEISRKSEKKILREIVACSKGCIDASGAESSIVSSSDPGVSPSPSSPLVSQSSMLPSPAPYFVNISNDSSIKRSRGVPMELLEDDIIVEKMHIHYGMKGKNPVARLRFFPKNAGPRAVGSRVDEALFRTSLPTAFEEYAVRVFCRFPESEGVARQAFELWSEKNGMKRPFPHTTQQ